MVVMCLKDVVKWVLVVVLVVVCVVDWAVAIWFFSAVTAVYLSVIVVSLFVVVDTAVVKWLRNVVDWVFVLGWISVRLVGMYGVVTCKSVRK